MKDTNIIIEEYDLNDIKDNTGSVEKTLFTNPQQKVFVLTFFVEKYDLYLKIDKNLIHYLVEYPDPNDESVSKYIVSKNTPSPLFNVITGNLEKEKKLKLIIFREDIGSRLLNSTYNQSISYETQILIEYFDPNDSGSGLSMGAIIGIAVGGIIFLVIVIVGIVCCVKKKKKGRGVEVKIVQKQPNKVQNQSIKTEEATSNPYTQTPKQ